MTSIDLMMHSPEQARARLDELAQAVKGVEGVKIYAGYRQIRVGDLVINVMSAEKEA